MSSYSREQLEQFLGRLDIKADRVLDVGGSQLPVRGRTKVWEVDDYRIADLPVPHKSVAPIDYYIDLNKRDFYQTAGQFDVVFCLEVMEYIFDPMTALNNLASLTKKGGQLYISFHFLYPLHPPKGQDFLRYTKYGAEKLVEEAGFEIDLVMSRELKSREHYYKFINWEGFRYDKTDENIYSSGIIIKATKL